MPGLDIKTKLLLHCNGSNGSIIFKDSSPLNRTINVNNNAQITTTQFIWGGSALSLDGTGDSLWLADSADWDIFATTTEDWTIDFWVKHNSSSANIAYMAHYQDGNNLWYLHYRPSLSELRFSLVKGGVGYNVIASTFSWDTAWHHIAIAKVGQIYGIYLDGTQIAYNLISTTGNFTGRLNIGMIDSTRSDNYFALNGYMDEIRIQKYNSFSASPNVGLTDTIAIPSVEYSDDTKLLLHCNGTDGSTSFLDASILSHGVITAGNAQVDTAQSKFGGASALFDGTGDSLWLADYADWDIFATTTEDWTIDFWVKHNSSSANIAYMAHYQDSNNYWYLQWRPADTLLRLTLVTSGSGILNVSGTVSSWDSNWHHICLIKKGQLFGIYLDGVQIAYASSTAVVNKTGRLNIGAIDSTRSDAYFNLNGWIDEIRICKQDFFQANPVVGLTDTIEVPTLEYPLYAIPTITSKNSQGIIIV